MAGINKTNAARLLDRAKIQYELVPYVVDENNLAANHIAEQLGEDIRQVFKTLVLHGDRTGYFVCVVPGNAEVDLKKAAKASGNKKCDLIPMKELLPTTGYIRGGCSPIGMKKAFPTFFHATCEDFDSFSEVSHIDNEASLLRRRLITREALDNRRLLRRLMRAQGFTTYRREWWHFQQYDINYARRTFRLLDF